MMETVLYTPKCDSCGRFFSYNQPGSSWVFVPDSDISYEENKVRCRECTERHGRPIPLQTVNIDICSGVVSDDKEAHS